MRTSYKPPQGSYPFQEPPNAANPNKTPPALQITRVVKRKVAPTAPQGTREGYPREEERGERQSTMRRGTLEEPEIGDGHVVLHRSTNFYVRTTNRGGQRRNPLRRRSGHTMLMPTVVPEQEQRIAGSETRMMPNVAPINPLGKSVFAVPHWVEAMVVVFGLLLSLAAHAFNMFNYPQYGLDEGTYMSSAWAILHGQITPYPYGYGHPPLAWIQIALWASLTGGLFTFGNAINSGRVLMLLYSTGSSLLVYLIFRRLHGSRSGALLAMAIFSLSPLCITYQRLVLLDNVGTFWVLLALYLIVVGESRLLSIVLSGVAFGMALLSKEVLLLFFPGMIYAVWLHTTKFQRKFALVAFTYTVIAMGSSFVLMAVLKGELLPTGWLPWDHHEHLSLFTTYLGQIQRGQNQGNLQDSMRTWAGEDLPFLLLGVATTLFNLVAGWWNRKLLLLALLAMSFWVLFLRNGVTFPFYIIPLLPFTALNIATTMLLMTRWLNKLLLSSRHAKGRRDGVVAETLSSQLPLLLSFVHVALILLFLTGVVAHDAQTSRVIFTRNLTAPQTKALVWVRNNIPHNAVVVINSYFFTDLHEPGGDGVGNGAVYPYAHVYWNVAYDPEIRDTLLKHDWQRIDYIVTDAPMAYDIEHLGGDMEFVNTALQHAVLLVDFRPSKYDSQDAIQIYQVNHTTTSPLVERSGYPQGVPNRGQSTVGADLSCPSLIYRRVCGLPINRQWAR